MNNPRLVLWLILGFILYLNYEAWMRDYSRPSPTASATQVEPDSSGRDIGANIPNAASSSAAPAVAPAPAANGSQAPAPAGETNSTAAAPPVRVRTDVLDLDIALIGGTIERADLLQYPKVKGKPEPVRLMNTDPATLYLLQTGLTGAKPGEDTPTHVSAFTSAKTEYDLGNASELRVPLTWTDPNGVTVTKTFILRRGSYRIDLEYDIENHSGAAWAAAPYAQILRRDPVTKRSMFSTNVENFSFHGPALHDGVKYEKLKIDDTDNHNLSLDVTNGWIAALQHHFLTAVIPPSGQTFRFTLTVDGPKFVITAAGPLTAVAPGGSAKLGETLFIGPKLQAQLEQVHPELDRAADYGILYLLASPLFWLLEQLHKLFNNWGWAIVGTTFLLKLAFYPLSEASGRSMAKMKLLAPRLKGLQETYKDDREKLGRAMMELYKREKVNPAVGCVPMLIQIPVFLAFYWVLLESVEMRQAPFVGWINDLSAQDPFYILPAIMAAGMFVQYKLNPAPTDPVQQKVFMIMPFAMSVMFAFFPAGLVLYWVTNTLLSIAQQWNINRRIEKEKKAAS